MSPADTVMVGDSVSDIIAAHSVWAAAIRYANNPRRGVELRTAGADLLIDEMLALSGLFLNANRATTWHRLERTDRGAGAGFGNDQIEEPQAV